MRTIREPRVLDLGTGSGCIAVTLALECSGACVVAIDASPAALAVARENASRLGASVAFHVGDWYDAVPAGLAFDVVVANPPYVAPGDPHLDALRFEPMQALTDGLDGLACLRTIIEGAKRRLVPGGWLLVEHGYDQAPEVGALFASGGLSAQTLADGAGHPRVTFGRPGKPDV
jgi:release factor glutamine methyltransferase